MSLSRLVAGALLAASLSHAQSPKGSISGVVLDSQTGRPVAGATVAIDGNGGGQARTDSEGHYMLSVAPGSHKLKITAEEYHEVELTEVLVEPGEVAEASTVMSNMS